MRRNIEGHATPYPSWAICFDLADGDPIRAREIFEQIDATWFHRALAWRKAHAEAKAKK